MGRGAQAALVTEDAMCRPLGGSWCWAALQEREVPSEEGDQSQIPARRAPEGLTGSACANQWQMMKNADR